MAIITETELMAIAAEYPGVVWKLRQLDEDTVYACASINYKFDLYLELYKPNPEFQQDKWVCYLTTGLDPESYPEGHPPDKGIDSDDEDPYRTHCSRNGITAYEAIEAGREAAASYLKDALKTLDNLKEPPTRAG